MAAPLVVAAVGAAIAGAGAFGFKAGDEVGEGLGDGARILAFGVGVYLIVMVAPGVIKALK